MKTLPERLIARGEALRIVALSSRCRPLERQP